VAPHADSLLNIDLPLITYTGREPEPKPADTGKGKPRAIQRSQNCYHRAVENRTEPRTVMQWIRYVAMALIALVLVWAMLRMYVL
jgi:hypothetical protein